MTQIKNTEDFDVQYLANLARIELSEKEVQEMQNRLRSIIHYLDKLNTIDVSDIEATAHTLPAYNVWEEDNPSPLWPPEEALMNAPKIKNNQIVVPKTVE